MEVMIIMNLEKNFYLLTNIVNKILKRNLFDYNQRDGWM